MQQTKNAHYKKQAEISHKKWVAAAHVGEEKEALKHQREYENYIGMIEDE